MTFTNVCVPRHERIVDWGANLARVLHEPDLIRPVYQPIYDLARSRICGYEVLARFELEPKHSPIAWLEAAEEHGLDEPMQTALFEAGLRGRGKLPENCFLTINISPSALLCEPLQAAIENEERLDAVVIELTEREAVDDYATLNGVIEMVRRRGGMIAVDDAGAGYASLQHIMCLRPEFIKLDRALVAGLDADPAKLALVEAVGSFAARIDSWVVAEGIERGGELDAVRSIGVPLAQGFGLGMPAPSMLPGELEPNMRPLIDLPSASRELATILTRALPLWSSELGRAQERFAREPLTDFLVVVDDRERVLGLLRRETRDDDVTEPLIAPLQVLLSESPEAVARRAMTRSLGQRFDPIVARDERGRYVGLLPTDQLVHLLARIINERNPT
jgi:EAL domain-containing protein (putative c-di-GMP-specific phosphodiesterase class I)